MSEKNTLYVIWHKVRQAWLYKPLSGSPDWTTNADVATRMSYSEAARVRGSFAGSVQRNLIIRPTSSLPTYTPDEAA